MGAPSRRRTRRRRERISSSRTSRARSIGWASSRSVIGESVKSSARVTKLCSTSSRGCRPRMRGCAIEWRASARSAPVSASLVASLIASLIMRSAPVSASDGRGWPRMAADGLGWPRMASDGRGWPRMASVGICSHLAAAAIVDIARLETEMIASLIAFLIASLIASLSAALMASLIASPTASLISCNRRARAAGDGDGAWLRVRLQQRTRILHLAIVDLVPDAISTRMHLALVDLVPDACSHAGHAGHLPTLLSTPLMASDRI